MFRIITISAFVATAAFIIYLYRGDLSKLKRAFNLRQWFRIPEVRPDHAREDRRRRISFFTKVSFAILAVTGFAPVIILGESVSGFVLILHAVAAPFFALGLVAISVWWADRHLFTKEDWQKPPSAGAETREQAGRDLQQFYSVAQKISFWLILVLALPVIGSIVLSMHPFFGTDGQETLLHLHGYSGLFLLIVVVVRFCFSPSTAKASLNNPRSGNDADKEGLMADKDQGR